MVINPPNNRVRSIAGTIFIFLAGLAVVLSETMKFLHVPAVAQKMAEAGFPGGKLTLVASLGFASAALFLYPRTRSIGILLLSSFLGGAICLHVQRGENANVFGPSTLLALAWAGTWLRHPQLLWSFGHSRFEADKAHQHSLVSREA
jgi:hypothetical protein